MAFSPSTLTEPATTLPPQLFAHASASDSRVGDVRASCVRRQFPPSLRAECRQAPGRVYAALSRPVTATGPRAGRHLGPPVPIALAAANRYDGGIVGALTGGHRRNHPERFQGGLAMKSALFVMVVACSLVSSAWARQWTSRGGGFSVEAELVDVEEGNVILRRRTGRKSRSRWASSAWATCGTLTRCSTRPKRRSAANRRLPVKDPRARPCGSGPCRCGGAAIPMEKRPVLRLQREDHGRPRRLQREARRRGHLQGEIRRRRRDPTANDLRPVGRAALGPHANCDPPGRHVRFYSTAEGSRNATIVVDPLGHVVRVEGDSALPFLLGELRN